MKYEAQLSHLTHMVDLLKTMLEEAEVQQNASAAADCRKQLAHIESEIKRLSKERKGQQKE